MRRVKDYKIPYYNIRQKDLYINKSSKNKISHYLAAKDSFHPIPGLQSTDILGVECHSMVPQGICTCENYVLTTSYDSSNTYNSAIYVLENNKLIATLIYDKKVHMGGITYDGSYIWIAEGGGSIHGNEMGAIKKDDFFNAVNTCVNSGKNSIQLTNILTCQAEGLKYTSFCSFYDNILWIGSFSTSTTSHIYGYKVCFENEQLSLKPIKYMEAPKKAQGICFYNSQDTTFFCVSTSYGRRYNSVFRCYKLKDYNHPTETFNNIPQIMKNTAYRTLTFPPMSEQINIIDNLIYCIFESAANKYIKNSLRPIGSYCIFDADKFFK